MSSPHDTPDADELRRTPADDSMQPTEEMPRPDVPRATLRRSGTSPPTAQHEDAPRTFETGQLIAGRYRITRFIAAGGRGEVYEALDLDLDERVAVKCIRQQAAADPKAVLRLKRELHLARRITHPNICRLFDVGYHVPNDGSEPLLFLTMELLEGETLVRYLMRHERLAPEVALPIVEQLCDGLEAAHSAGVIHRDFKSDNVMLVPTKDGGRRAVIMDFGLARADSGSGFLTLTATGKVVGTPAYMAPEQIQGAEVDRRADLYALGVVMFEMLTGKLPFIGDSPLSTAVKRLKRAPPSPREHLPELDRRWERVTVRCLARDPARRYGSAQEVKEDLAAEDRTSHLSLPRPRIRTLPLWVRVGVSGLLLAVVVGAAYQLRQRGRSATKVEPAQVSNAASIVEGRPVIGVLELHSLIQDDAPDWRGEVLAQLVVEGLRHLQWVRSVPYDTLWWQAREDGIEASQLLDHAASRRAGTSLRVDYLLTGTYLSLGGEGLQSLRMDLRLIRSRDGETVTTIGVAGTEDALPQLADRVIEELAQQLDAGAQPPILTLSRQFDGVPTAGLRALFEARQALRMSELRTAERQLAEASRLMPEHPAVESESGRLLSRQGRTEAAQQAFRSAWLHSSKRPVEMRLRREVDYRRSLGEWARVVEIESALSKLSPDELSPSLDLVNAQMELGHTAEARRLIASLRERFTDPESAARLDLLEAQSSDLGIETPRRVELARSAVQLAKESGDRRFAARARLALAEALASTGQAEAGVVALRPALPALQELGDVGLALEVRCRMAQLRLASGHPDAALAEARQVLQEASDRGLDPLAAQARAVLQDAAATAQGQS